LLQDGEARCGTSQLTKAGSQGSSKQQQEEEQQQQQGQ